MQARSALVCQGSICIVALLGTTCDWWMSISHGIHNRFAVKANVHVSFMSSPDLRLQVPDGAPLVLCLCGAHAPCLVGCCAPHPLFPTVRRVPHRVSHLPRVPAAVCTPHALGRSDRRVSAISAVLRAGGGVGRGGGRECIPGCTSACALLDRSTGARAYDAHGLWLRGCGRDAHAA